MRLWTRVRRPSGSRPVPKWAAGLAAVFALGGGEAAAQLTADSTFDGNGLQVDVAARVAEGANTPITVTLKASVAAGTESATAVTSPSTWSTSRIPKTPPASRPTSA